MEKYLQSNHLQLYKSHSNRSMKKKKRKEVKIWQPKLIFINDISSMYTEYRCITEMDQKCVISQRVSVFHDHLTTCVGDSTIIEDFSKVERE